MTPLRIVVDASATSEAAARVAARHAVHGIGGRGTFLFYVGAANSVLGVLYLLFHGLWYFGWVYLGLGVMQILVARSGSRLWRDPMMPAEIVVSDAGLAIAVRGETQARAYPWKRVRTAINNNDFITIIVGTTNLTAFQRAIAVPKPDDAALCDAIWAALYAHMIAPRNLRATPLDRLGVIRNTAFA